jgi:tellurite resistance protein TehA-like permease
MITWTDIFEGTGNFFQLIFKGMRLLGHGPNVIIAFLVVFSIGYWIFRLIRYRKEASRNSTVE